MHLRHHSFDFRECCDAKPLKFSLCCRQSETAPQILIASTGKNRMHNPIRDLGSLFLCCNPQPSAHDRIRSASAFVSVALLFANSITRIICFCHCAPHRPNMALNRSLFFLRKSARWLFPSTKTGLQTRQIRSKMRPFVISPRPFSSSPVKFVVTMSGIFVSSRRFTML